MNKLFTKIVGACLGLAMAICIGVVVETSKTGVVPVNAAQGDVLAEIQGTGSSYGRQTATDSYNVGWVTIGQNGYLGINSAKNNTGAKAGVNATDLPVAKAVNANATSSTSMESNSCTGYYVFYTTTALKNVGSLEFYYSVNSGNSSATGYVVMGDAKSASGGAAYVQVPLATSSTSKQGVNLEESGTFTFMFAETQTEAKYYGFVVATSSYKRMTDGKITLKEGATSTPSISTDSTTNVKVGSTATLEVTYANLASGVTISATSSNPNAVTVTSSVNTTGASGTANFTITGVAEGTATISFSATYQGSPLNCSSTVSAYLEYSYKKITKSAELNTSRSDGGRYVISYSEDNSIVMSTTQNPNNRGNTSATISGDEMVIPGSSSIAVINILKVGDYYTIYDKVNSGYLYAVSGNNHLKTGNPETKTNYYYWSISFSDNNAVIANKGNNYVIEYNSSSSIFSTYNNTQKAIQLWELDSDIPEYVKLASLTANDNSVEAGSTLSYTATYLPVNASESIQATSSSDAIATVDSSSMSNGVLTVTITGVASGTITLSLVGDDPNTVINTSVTITVTSFTPTHILVTSSSSLSNGSKVIIGCTAEEFDFTAEKSTGTNNLNGIATGFANDKSSLSAAETSQEFVVWCVDTTNGYYVFSDGGYYLQAPNSEDNYLQRTDTLSENCYFTLTNDSNGVVVTSNLHNAYSIQFNSGTSKFSLYKTTQKSSSLYLSKDEVNCIQGFVDVFMHMETYTTNSGYCADEFHHYYLDAKAAFLTLTDAQRETFCTDTAYTNAHARLSSWADANGDYINENFSLVQQARVVVNNAFGKSNSSIAIVIVISLVSFTAIGGYFFLRKRKEH